MEILFSLMMAGTEMAEMAEMAEVAEMVEMTAGGLAVEVVVVETMEEAVVGVGNSYL